MLLHHLDDLQFHKHTRMFHLRMNMLYCSTNNSPNLFQRSGVKHCMDNPHHHPLMALQNLSGHNTNIVHSNKNYYLHHNMAMYMYNHQVLEGYSKSKTNLVIILKIVRQDILFLFANQKYGNVPYLS